MQTYVVLYLLAAAAIALLAYPIVRYARGRADGLELVISLSIPVLVGAVLFIGSGVAHAQPAGGGIPGLVYKTPPAGQIAGPYSSWFPPGQTGWEIAKPPTATPVPAAGAAGPAVAVNTGGTAVITRPQLPNINVPVTTRTVIPAAAAAAAAGRAAAYARAAMGPVGAAWLAWDIYKNVKDSGVSICPPPDFFCFPPTVTFDRLQLGWYLSTFNLRGSLSSIEAFLVKQYSGTVVDTKQEKIGTTPVVTWTIKAADGGRVTFAAQYQEGALIETTKPGPPMTDGDLENHMKNAGANDSTGQKASDYYKGAMDAHEKMQQAGKPGLDPSSMMPPASSTTTITSTPVTVGPENIGTKTGTDATGQPTSTTTSATTTVTPTVTGNGSSSSITYNITYQTTNVTNNPSSPSTPPKTETTTVVVRVEPSSVPQPPATEFPKDYNKEVTQQQILGLLKGEGMPDGSTLNPDTQINDVQGVQGTIRTAIDQVTPESTGFKGWLPQIPTTVCENPRVPTPLSGDMQEFEICKPVSILQKLISGVIVVLLGYAAVREVQSCIKP